ncbi:MAG TPA: alpha/beta hydrolase [Burkholderiaceae bacterium]|nr:alpha/beta hydrolase [Burkholderiaceae bacterium]
MNDFAGRQLSALRTATRRPGTQRNMTWIAAGAALAAAALLVRQRTQRAEHEHPPAGHFMYVDGVRLHYVERGQGQPLVLLHGDGSMIQDFEISGLIDLAASKYRVIVFDRPGYGYSRRPRDRIWGPQAQAALLHHALQLLDVEQPIVLGHSWGTMVALSLALDYPNYVKSLVLLSGYYYPTVRIDAPLLSPPALPVIGDLMRYTVSPLIGRMIWPLLKWRIFTPAPVTERFSSEFPVWMALRPLHLRASAAEAAMMIPSAFMLSKRYHELSVPSVIVAGDGDTYVNTHVHSEHLHRDLPQSEYRTVPGAGHMVHHLAPQQVMAAIDRAAQVAQRPAGQGVPQVQSGQSGQFEYYGS